MHDHAVSAAAEAGEGKHPATVPVIAEMPPIFRFESCDDLPFPVVCREQPDELVVYFDSGLAGGILADAMSRTLSHHINHYHRTDEGMTAPTTCPVEQA